MKYRFQSRKRLYNHQCPSVSPLVCQQNPSTAWNHHPSSFFIHPSLFFIILHSSFLHFATFKLFSLLFHGPYLQINLAIDPVKLGYRSSHIWSDQVNILIWSLKGRLNFFLLLTIHIRMDWDPSLSRLGNFIRFENL